MNAHEAAPGTAIGPVQSRVAGASEADEGIYLFLGHQMTLKVLFQLLENRSVESKKSDF